MQWARKQTGFTIVELLIVVVVIAILAAITIVAYNGLTDRSKESTAKAAVDQAYKKVESYYMLNNNTYPASLATVGITDGTVTNGYSAGNQYRGSCVWSRVGAKQFSMQGGIIIEGDCGQVVASYYNDQSLNNLVFTRAENNVANTWGTGTPDSRIPTDYFSAKYEMRIIPPVTDTYTFYTNTDDSAQLLVDGQAIIPWTAAGTRDATSTTVNLTAGVPVRVVYSMYEIGGSAYATLSWSYTGQARVTIPASQFLRPY